MSAGQITWLDAPHQIRNYNTALLLSRLRPLNKKERAEQIEMLRWGPWGPLIVALKKASQA